MTIKIAITPEGIIAREFNAGGERSWRLNNLGHWACCLDHKGPWISCSSEDVPIRVKGCIEFNTEGE